jgi:hypothetical protein
MGVGVVNADTVVTLGLGDGWMTRKQGRLGRVRRYSATQSANHMQHDIPNLLSYTISLQRRRSE